MPEKKEAGKVDPHSVGRNGSKGGVLIFIEQISNGVSQQEDNCVRKQSQKQSGQECIASDLMADRLSFFSWMAADDGLDSLSNAGGDGNKNQSDVCKDPIGSDTGISA